MLVIPEVEARHIKEPCLADFELDQKLAELLVDECDFPILDKQDSFLESLQHLLLLPVSLISQLGRLQRLR